MSEADDFFKEHFQIISVTLPPKPLTAAERREADREFWAEHQIPTKEWAEAGEPPSDWEP